MATTFLAAAGEASATASSVPITSKRSAQLTAGGTATATGSASLVRSLPSGGLTDFGFWDSSQPDAVMTRSVNPAGAGIGTDVTASRAHISATAPKEYNPTGSLALWKSAAYAGVGIKWTGMPNAQTHAYSQVQFEEVSFSNRLSWAATSWEEAATYVAHPLTHYCEVSRSSEASYSGSYSGKIVYSGHSVPAGIWGYGIVPVNRTGMVRCAPGEFVGGSVAVKMQRAALWTVGVMFFDENFQMIGANWYYKAQSVHPGGGKWAVSAAQYFTAPAGTAWVAAGPRISVNSSWDARDNVAVAGEVAYTDMHRVWTFPYSVQGTPTDYVSPRKLTIDIKANRVNLVNNPSIASATAGWGTGGYGTMPFPGSYDGTQGRLKPGAYKFSTPADLTPYTPSAIMSAGLLTNWSTSSVGGFGWKPSTIYTSSVYVKLGPNCPNLTLEAGYAPIDGVLTTDAARAEHPELIDGEWIRLWATYMTGPGENGLISLSVTLKTAEVQATGSGALFWIDDALIEEGSTVGEYFDGNSPGADFLWAGTENFSSSHYYQGFRSNAYRLNDIAKSALPHGTQVELRYAQPPL
ncbi:hypothetical protein ACIOHC_35940 [Streptomyces sp. NPDC088252]|uniref:hypothetical protein n=1 Tax=Streptomyces sp. NPDC088252 TaxID=3365845 RepID=UPI00382B2DA5